MKDTEDFCFYVIHKEEGRSSLDAMLKCGCYDCKDRFYETYGMS